MTITLYDFWRSSAAYRMRIAFGLLGLDYTSIVVDLPSEQNRSPEHLARNPQGLVPAVEIDGRVMTQS
ncbi:MAG: maleylacetoacetate isomerase, partial [Betaproteobacteria bacterium HGW-Betaproteobacteria-17]